jgi:hypothetical protein
MREETRKKLERAIWIQRAKVIGIGLGIAAVIGAIFVYEDIDSHTENVRVPGTVVAIGPLNTTSTQAIENGLSVDVALANGRRVNVMVLKTSNPTIGEKVEITEHRHRTGRVQYTWK